MGTVNPFRVVCDKISKKGVKKMDFAERLKKIRKESGLTQKQVYEKLGISANGYASYEQGRTEPSIHTLITLCEIFDVSADYLLGLED